MSGSAKGTVAPTKSPPSVHSEDAPGYTISAITRRTVEKKRPRFSSPRDVFEFVRKELEGKDREHFYALLLNTKNEVLAMELVSVGSLNASIVHPREILKPAILASAASIILVHNHPTGDPAPSREDVEFTRRFAGCGELMGIELLDHIIIGDSTYHSLKESSTF